jgi:hypothetical protein
MKSIKQLVWAMFLLTIPAMAASHSVGLSWTPGSDDTGFNIYRASGVCPATVTPTTTGFSKLGSSTVDTYTDATVTLGTWCYFVTGTANSAESAASNSVNPVVAPFAPTALTVVVVQ